VNKLVLFSCLIAFSNAVIAQHLSFTQPVPILAPAKTDQALDITPFNERYFIAWKQSGKTGNILACCLGKHHDTGLHHTIDTIPNSSSAFGPVLRTFHNQIYLFWIAGDGSLKYVINRSDTSFDVQQIRTLATKNNIQLSSGINASVLQDKIILASHANNKKNMVYALVSAGADGELSAADWQTIPNNSSANFPFVVRLNDNKARFCWRAYKNDDVYYADYDAVKNTWSSAQQAGHTGSKVSPAVYHIWDKERLFYIWKGEKSDNRMYYVSAESNELPAQETVLPPAFQTPCPVSICIVDDNNFMMAYPGQDQQIYLSYFSNYDPASWMQDVLMPYAADYTLQDIVLPGAHDAGMSVLTATGGVQKGTINTCNTLTQTQNITNQLQAGIRMFDLRAGLYQNELYARHSSSDCMEDAMGGGYGEKLRPVFENLKRFLTTHPQEIVLISFSHFCEKELPVSHLADSIVHYMGSSLLYQSQGKKPGSIPLRELAGKAIISFEHDLFPGKPIETCAISDQSSVFINFRRAYAATNDLNKLLQKEKDFFQTLQAGTIRDNDLVRLDWQLTQSSEEAAMVCNDFEDEKLNPAVNGAVLLTNLLMKHRNITELALKGNKSLYSNLQDWISSGLITKKNKPNILYVDVAGAWITDYCIDLNNSILYKKK
jgi:hypothetical protein